jgi:hypothetical protein
MRGFARQLQSTQLNGSQVHVGFSHVVEILMARSLPSPARLTPPFTRSNQIPWRGYMNTLPGFI